MASWYFANPIARTLATIGVSRASPRLLTGLEAIPKIANQAPIHSQWSMPVDFVSIFRALNELDARYVLVGGLAVILHGVDRLTADVDLTVDLAPEQSSRAISALQMLGLKPNAPLQPQDFTVESIRESWRIDKGMTVFSFWDPTHLRPSVDLFIRNPIPFPELWAESVTVELDAVPIRIASIAHLIRLKEISNRPRDVADIALLRELLGSP